MGKNLLLILVVLMTFSNAQAQSGADDSGKEVSISEQAQRYLVATLEANSLRMKFPDALVKTVRSFKAQPWTSGSFSRKMQAYRALNIFLEAYQFNPTDEFDTLTHKFFREGEWKLHHIKALTSLTLEYRGLENDEWADSEFIKKAIMWARSLEELFSLLDIFLDVVPRNRTIHRRMLETNNDGEYLQQRVELEILLKPALKELLGESANLEEF